MEKFRKLKTFEEFSEDDSPKLYIKNIDTETIENTNYRHVVFTGEHLQLVLMSLQPEQEIGEEIHNDTDQFFRIEEGEGKVVINGKEYEFKKDFAFVITAGAKHNIINTGKKELKLYTIYTPPHHPNGTIEPEKKEEK